MHAFFKLPRPVQRPLESLFPMLPKLYVINDFKSLLANWLEFKLGIKLLLAPVRVLVTRPTPKVIQTVDMSSLF